MAKKWNVTIKRRLFWSNILMIVVPVVITLMVALCCIGLIWRSWIGGIGNGFEDEGDFTHACRGVSEIVDHQLEQGKDLNVLGTVVEDSNMRIQLEKNGIQIFASGTQQKIDSDLMKAAASLGDDSMLSNDGRGLYLHRIEINDAQYTLYLWGATSYQGSYESLEVWITITACLLILAVLLSILLTNRILTKHLFRRIEEPLDILSYGVHQIRDGNLEHRIRYQRNDEFLPICSDFNDMAVRLKESVLQEQQQEKSRKELLAGISHDIRSPLTSIQAYVEGLLDGVAKTPEMQKHYLHTIKAKAEDLAHMISQLFLFSKMDLDEYPENPQVLQLDQEIETIVSAVKDDFSQQGLEIQTDLTTATIYADPAQIHRIVTNILENSVKYKSKELGTARITLAPSERGCLLSIEDDGPGVSESTLPHLFEVFYRSDPARQNPHNGSGLGLAIVARAAKRMNATVSAHIGSMGGLEIRIDFLCSEEQKHEENPNR